MLLLIAVELLDHLICEVLASQVHVTLIPFHGEGSLVHSHDCDIRRAATNIDDYQVRVYFITIFKTIHHGGCSGLSDEFDYIEACDLASNLRSLLHAVIKVGRHRNDTL